jgi:chromosome partitioning protein
VKPSIISIANTAGGSGKTTLAHALSVAFTEYGKKTLVIDLDPRASLTFRVGRENSRKTISDYLLNTLTLEDLDPLTERFDFIASDSRSGVGYSEEALQSLINSLPKEYDLIVFDTPSDINAGLIASLQVADLILIPYSQTIHHYRGITQIHKLAPDTKKSLLLVGNESAIADQFKQWQHLDGQCSLADEIGSAELTELSVLSTSKNSAIAAEMREAAYSVLEVLGID